MIDEVPYQLIKLRPTSQNELKSSSWVGCKTECQLFYSESCNKFLLNDYKSLTLFNRNEQIIFDAGIKGPVQFLSYSDQQRSIVYCPDKSGGLIYRSLKNPIQMKLKQPKDILHIEWLSNKCLSEFIVVQALGLRFYRLEDQKKGLKEIKFISMKINACWFQSKSQVLVTRHNSDKGVLNIFHLRDKRNKNLYKSGSLQLDLKENTTKFKAGSTFANQPLFKNTYNELFQVQLMNLYEKTVVVVLNLINGVLQFYQLEPNEVVKLTLVVNLPTDSPAVLTTYDNLVLIHLLNDKISFVYDTKRVGSQPVATPAAIGQQVIYEGHFLNRWALVPEGRVFKWQIQPQAIFKYIKNEGELFLFLMRRRNCKMVLLKWLRQHLFTFKATIVSNFFKVIFGEHYEALKLGDAQVVEQTISPVDIYANVFFPVQSDPQKQRLVDIMLEAQRQMSINKLETPAKFQSLVVNLLLESKRQQLLAQLIQSRVVEDSKDMAMNLLEHSSTNGKQQILQQVAIDILHRHGLFTELIGVFCRLGLISQLIRTVRLHFQQIPIQALITIYRECKQQYKVRLGSALKDLGRELYPPSTQQTLTLELQK